MYICMHAHMCTVLCVSISYVCVCILGMYVCECISECILAYECIGVCIRVCI